MAGQLGCHVDIYSNAKALADPGLFSRVRRAGEGLRMRLLVPFFGTDKAGHDRAARCPGAFVQSLVGLTRWSKYGEAGLGVYLTRSSLRGLPGFVRTAAGLLDGSRERVIQFILRGGSGWCRSSRAGELPSWKAAMPHVREAAAVAREEGMRIEYVGLPECMLGSFPWGGVDSWRRFDISVVEDGTVRNVAKSRSASEKVKADACRGCMAEGTCEGLWRSYVDRYGDEEMIPVEKSILCAET
jgi:hypothetical protein